MKYKSVRTWSNLCNRWFSSKLETRRAEELHLLELAGAISDLHYQVKFVLSESPRITISIDFCYQEDGKWIYEDTKGFLTRDFRSKMAWLKEKYNVEVMLKR